MPHTSNLRWFSPKGFFVTKKDSAALSNQPPDEQARSTSEDEMSSEALSAQTTREEEAPTEETGDDSVGNGLSEGGLPDSSVIDSGEDVLPAQDEMAEVMKFLSQPGALPIFGKLLEMARTPPEDDSEPNSDSCSKEPPLLFEKIIEDYDHAVYPICIGGPADVEEPTVQTVLRTLSSKLDGPLFCLVHGDGPRALAEINHITYDAIFQALRALTASRETIKFPRVYLLIHSPGGLARYSYKIACLLKNICDEFIVILPNMAKSAGTLLLLGADRVIMDTHAEIGPLDAQIYSMENEVYQSALDGVKAFDHISAMAIQHLDATMATLTQRTGKTINSLLPHAADFASKSIQPLMASLDAVQISSSVRILNVAEQYGRRLMTRRGVDSDTAKQIAWSLISDYSEHGFVIDFDEAKELGLPVEKPKAPLAAMLTVLNFQLQGGDGPTMVGIITEAKK